MASQKQVEEVVIDIDADINNIWIKEWMQKPPVRVLEGSRCLNCLKNVEIADQDIYVYADCGHFFCVPCFCRFFQTTYCITRSLDLPDCPLCGKDLSVNPDPKADRRLLVDKYTPAWSLFLPVNPVKFTTPPSRVSKVTVAYPSASESDRQMKQDPIPLGRRVIELESYAKFKFPNILGDLKRTIQHLEERVAELEEAREVSDLKKRRI